MISKRIRLLVALALFIAWMGYLSYAALTKSHSPILSHAQVAAAELAVVAEVESTPQGEPFPKAKVVESLTPGGPPPATELLVPNLLDAHGYEGPGQYLLLLVESGPQFYVVGQLRSPGNDFSSSGKPAIYRWSDDIRKQYETLHR